MKKNLKAFFIFIASFLTILGNHSSHISYADLMSTEIERMPMEIAKDCPAPNDPRLISICGSVRQATAHEKKLPDGTYAERAAQVPVEGVTVQVYECDNQSPTCKRDGLLVQPFSSTTTNEYGKFHLVARKMDNNWDIVYRNAETGEPDTLPAVTQSKKRYLIFKCGDIFEGIHVIPSYANLTNVIHEVACTNVGEEGFEYIAPSMELDFVQEGKLANQMGIDLEGYPEQAAYDPSAPTTTNEDLHVAAQVYYERYKNETLQSVFIKLDGADPRFTPPYQSPGKEEALRQLDIYKALFNIGDLGNVVPTLGAWYSYDCYHKYNNFDSKWTELCAGYGIGNAHKGPGDNMEYVDAYEHNLYEEPIFTVQHLLPNIAPKWSILYYRPLEVRHDISGFYQDHDDIAKFLALLYDSCVGPVFKRKIDEEKPLEYPNCEMIKACNQTLSPGRNTYTTTGFAQGLNSPGQFKELEKLLPTDLPICVIPGEEDNPVQVYQIQKPGESCDPNKHRLCEDGVYWSNFYVTNLGDNNLTAKIGTLFENNEDSYSRPERDKNGDELLPGDNCNGMVFGTDQEGDGVPMAGCQSATTYSGGATGNASIGAAAEISSGKENSNTENLSNAFWGPFENENTISEVASGIAYYISSKPVQLGQFSKVNDEEEYIITNTAADNKIYHNWYSDEETPLSAGKLNDNHYPGEDLKNKGLFAIGGPDGGPRTGTSGLYLTSPAWQRVQNLRRDEITSGDLDMNKWKLKLSDSLDSAISVSTGHSKIDWLMAEVRSQPTFWDVLEYIFDVVFSKNREKNKTFVDRQPEGLGKSEPDKIDSLKATGFEINELNFREKFPLPCVDTGLDPDDWGTEQACYPWHEIPYKQKCDTSQKEPRCLPAAAGSTGNEHETGINNKQISRTCRVDECYEAKASGDCTCTRKVAFVPVSYPPYREPVYSYEISDCPADINDVSISYDLGAECESADKSYNRVICAQKQTTCIQRVSPEFYGIIDTKENMKDCLRETYEDEIKNNIIEPLELSQCENLNWNSVCDISEDNCKLPVTKTISIPLCKMSLAGPNACDGNIERNVAINVEQQPTNGDSELRKINADGIPEAGYKFQKSFRDPFSLNIAPMPGAWISVASSMSDVEPDLSQRKDIAGIGTGTSFLVRAQFGHPNSFGAEQEFNEMYVHCENDDLGSTGEWEVRGLENKTCQFPELPNPEVLTLEEIIDKTPARSCDLNVSEECARLILGTSPNGEVLKFSETFEVLMNFAGNSFNIQPSALLAYMQRIGTANKYAYYWSEDGEIELQNVSLPWYGTFNFCDDLEHPAQHPFDWILTYFTMHLRNTKPPYGSPTDVLNELSKWRGTNTASRCNFLDGAVVLAGAITPSSPGCSQQTWSDVIEQIRTQLFGGDLRGSYGEDKTLDFEPIYKEIFETCK